MEHICQSILGKNQDILSIILVGSRARGDFNENGDYDFLFITKKGQKNEFDTIDKSKKLISEKTKIKSELINIHFWPIKQFKKEYKEGNSFIYCTIRDGKIISKNQQTIEKLKIPNCKIGGIKRLKFAKNLLSFIKERMNFKKEYKTDKRFYGLELEDFGVLCYAFMLGSMYVA